ncbi:MAG TPA: hypothetical protein PLL75_03415 [Candidatus Omnitrophota bacterium]|nr:hypothetical protein [Candidatus Omnitrophota bacterium]HPS36762.1 hypothetical protein [Candidatus Omnitrophota bacterium]
MLRKVAVWIIAGILLGLVSAGLNYVVYLEIQKRLEIRMAGICIPAVFVPSFEVRKGSFSWEDKVQLLDGDFKVTFDPLSLVSQRGIRILVTGRKSRIKFLGSWALQEGIENATVDSMNADIVLGRRGLAGINEIEVLSQSFQFSLKNADKKRSKKTGAA